MKLDEDQTRFKVIELLDMCNLQRFNMWLSSGILTGVLDGETVEKVMNEEIGRRSSEVQSYWAEPCDICTPIQGMCTHR